jgi:hypothetical protein
MARLLRQPRDATSEPAQVFDLLKLVAEAEISASERRR